MCVLQLWLLLVLEEGLGSSFHHVFLSLILPSSSLLTHHPRKFAYSWSILVFSLGIGRGSVACSWPVLPWERERWLLHAAGWFLLGKRERLDACSWLVWL